jgi:hypothetical protein
MMRSNSLVKNAKKESSHKEKKVISSLMRFSAEILEF